MAANISCFSACKGRSHPLSYDFQFLSPHSRELIEETTRERLSTIQTHINESMAQGRRYVPTPPITPIEKRRKRRVQRQKSIFGSFTFKVGKIMQSRTPKQRMLKRSATLLTAELEKSDKFKDLKGGDRVFGVKLETTVERQQRTNPESTIPSILVSIREALKPFMKEEGLFRVPANATHLNELQVLIEDEFNIDQPDEFKWDDVPATCLAALFKLYFKLLPIPLLTFKLHAEIFSMCKSGVFDKLPETLEKLPKCHQDTLHFVIDFLCEVANEEQNKMDILSLAIVISPNLLRSRVETPESILNDSKFLYMVVVDLMEERTAELMRENLQKSARKRTRRRSSVPERGKFGDLQVQEVERTVNGEKRLSYWLRNKRSHTKSLSGLGLENVEL